MMTVVPNGKISFSESVHQEVLTPLMSQLIVYGNARSSDSIYLVSFYFSNGEWRRNLHRKSKVSFQFLFLDVLLFSSIERMTSLCNFLFLFVLSVRLMQYQLIFCLFSCLVFECVCRRRLVCRVNVM